MVCGLALRWRWSRSEKNASSKGARRITAAPPSRAPGACRRARRQAALGIEAGAVPVAHGLHREGVAEVVDARAAPSVAGTGEFDQPDEDAIEVLVVDACTDT